MKILENIENALMNRTELKIIEKAEKNPSFAEATKIIADKNKVDEELIAIKKINGKFGRDTFLIHAFVYKNKEDKEKYEKKKVKKALAK